MESLAGHARWSHRCLWQSLSITARRGFDVVWQASDGKKQCLEAPSQNWRKQVQFCSILTSQQGFYKKHKGNERSFSILYFSVCLSLALLHSHTHMQKGRVGEKESRALSFKINQFSWGLGFNKGCGSRFHKRALITPSRTIQPAM